MSGRERCLTCGRELAGDTDWAHPSGCECASCVRLCWGSAQTCGGPYDDEPADEAESLRAELRWCEAELAIAEREVARLLRGPPITRHRTVMPVGAAHAAEKLYSAAEMRWVEAELALWQRYFRAEQRDLGRALVDRDAARAKLDRVRDELDKVPQVDDLHTRIKRALSDAPAHPSAEPECTGLAAVWCPRCGDCTCYGDAGVQTHSGKACPLHADESPHADVSGPSAATPEPAVVARDLHPSESASTVEDYGKLLRQAFADRLNAERPKLSLLTLPDILAAVRADLAEVAEEAWRGLPTSWHLGDLASELRRRAGR